MTVEVLVPVAFTVNGTPYEISVPARRLLSDALRHDLRLTGTHVGCEHGVCGAFQDCHALQCGFCTPGFITTITAYLEENTDPTAEEAREAISGNLCRCTGYQNIVAAVQRAAQLRAGGPPTEGSPDGPGGAP